MSMSKTALRALLNSLEKPPWMPGDDWVNLKRRDGIADDAEVKRITAAIDAAPEQKVAEALTGALGVIKTVLGVVA